MCFSCVFEWFVVTGKPLEFFQRIVNFAQE